MVVGQISTLSLILSTSELSTRIYPEDVMVQRNTTILNPCDVEEGFVISIVLMIITILIALVVCGLLWGVSDTYLVKIELTAVLSLGIILFPFWIASSLNIFPIFLYRYFWTMIVELTFSLVTIWLPVVASYQFERAIQEETKAEDPETKAVIGVELVKCIIDNPILFKHFER